MVYINSKIFVKIYKEVEMTSFNVKRNGTMFIFSGPSGCGKSTIIKRVLQELTDIELSVSVTTRERREGEEEGKDYYFISEEKFKELVENKALYEYVESDFGPKYGTPKEPVNNLLAKGKDVILDLDYPGVQQLRALAGERVKAISLIPPSLKILRERLVNRATDAMDVIERRMSMAEKRVNESRYYDYVVVNDDLEKAVNEVKSIIVAMRCTCANMTGIDDLIKKITDEK